MRWLSWFDGQEQAAGRMGRMMKALGVDVVSLAERRLGNDFAAARNQCMCCTEKAKCEAWLDGKQPDADPYAFCPNAALFDEHLAKVGR